MRSPSRSLLIAFLLAATPALAFDPGRDGYLMRCGGCHGIEGISVPATIPNLRNRAGRFLNSAQSRTALLTLPNVRMSGLDAPTLAAVLNFVAFDLGGTSAPPHAQRFTPTEIGGLGPPGPSGGVGAKPPPSPETLP